jgi:uroporphyrinogen-III decarboxylase
MSKRKQFIEYVKYGGEKFASPQIGSGSGFDTKIVGKEWNCTTSLDDTIYTTEQFDMIPLFNVGLPDASYCNPELGFKTVRDEIVGEKWFRKQELVTPKGTLIKESVEEKRNGGPPTKNPVEEYEDWDAFEWFLDGSLEADLSPLTNFVKQISDHIGDRGALSLQWGAQPYELLSWSNTVDTLFLVNDYPERAKILMDKILALDLKLMDCCQKGGADFIFLGAPASEIISPRYYEEFIVPYSKIITDEAHKRGLLVYSHICSPIEPMLSNGYFNQMGIDLFETLSMAPVGNVKSLADALTKLDEKICVRGNIGLDVLLNATPQEIEEHCFTALREAEGRKLILAASDYMFYQISAENVKALCESIKKYNTKKSNER